jgi:ParB family chromosome partitioning protein
MKKETKKPTATAIPAAAIPPAGGGGQSELFPDNSAPAVAMIEVAGITPDPANRKDHDPGELQRLAESIKTDGVLQPVILRPMLTGGHLLVAGERRWLAAKMAGLKRIPAIVRDYGSDTTATRQRAAENLHRENLTPVEEAVVYRQLLDAGMTQGEAAAFAGVSPPAFSNQLRILKLPAPVLDLVQAGKLTRAHAVSLVRFAAWPKAVMHMAKGVVEEEWSAKTLERQEVPFSYHLAHEKLLVSFASWNGFKESKTMKASPNWIVGKNTFYCFDAREGEAEMARQKAEMEARAGAGEKSSGGKGGGLGKAEKLRRAKTIAENKSKRAAVAAGMALAVKAINTDGLDAAMRVLLKEALGFQYCRHIAPAAGLLGLALPGKLKSAAEGGALSAEALYEGIGAEGALRVAAAAIVRRHSEQAMRGAWGVPEVVTFAAKEGRKK